MNAAERVREAFPCVTSDGRCGRIHCGCNRWQLITAVVRAAEIDAIERCALTLDHMARQAITLDVAYNYSFAAERIRALKEES